VAFALASGAANNTLRTNTATNASKGFDLSSGARDNDLADNVSIGAHDGFWVGDTAGRGNALTGNRSETSTNWGFVDLTTAPSGDFGTASTYSNNVCVANGADATPPQLC
jgi:parallel beta-helix repeat protein